jgi:hypothetical protein
MNGIHVLVKLWLFPLELFLKEDLNLCRGSHRTYFDADLAVVTDIIINCHHVIDHTNRNGRTEINATSAPRAFLRINLHHFTIPP